MKAKLNHIKLGFAKWYKNEIASMSWKTTFAMPVVNIIVANMINRNISAVKLLADEDGCIDIDLLHKEYAAIINNVGYIEIYGIKFNIQDLDKLYESIKTEIPTNDSKAEGVKI